MWYETFGLFSLYLPLVLFPTIYISAKLQKICHFGGINLRWPYHKLFDMLKRKLNVIMGVGEWGQ